MGIPSSLQEAISATPYVLALISALSTANLLARWWIASRWAALMDSAGFVDWPALENSTMPMICSVITILACVKCQKSTPRRVPAHRTAAIDDFHDVVSYMWLAPCIGFALTAFRTRIPDGTTLRLMGQAEAVASFNRAYCHAWCRRWDTSLLMLARGSCGPLKTTVFDEIIDMFDVGNWCKEAIEKQSYELLADYTGISPFANLKGEAAQHLTGTHEQMIWIASLCAVVSFVFTAIVQTRVRELPRDKPDEDEVATVEN